MKLSLAFLAAAPALVSGKRLSKSLDVGTDLSNVKIDAASKTGNKVLSKARRLDGGDETTWIAGYSLKFHSCTESQDYYGGYFAGNNGNRNYNGQNGNYNQGDANDGQNGNYYYGNRDDYAGMYRQKLVHFRLCPSDSCWRCRNGAEYVVELGDFVQAILEAKMTAEEYNCQQVRENCYCDNAYSEESCMYNCFKNAGMESCADAMYEEEFDLQDAAGCGQLQVEDEEAVMKYLYMHMKRPKNQNNGYYDANANGGNQQQEQGDIKGELFVGPHCSSNGKKIHLGVFVEETCSIAAPKGIYEATHYGDSLPYSKKSMVDSGCISCMEPKEVDYQNYWDQQDPDEATEVCTSLYEIAGKCEEGLDGYYPNRDVTGCSFIKTLKSSSSLSMPSAVPARVFAGIFAVTTVALGAVAATLWKKNSSQNVSLAGEPIIS